MNSSDTTGNTYQLYQYTPNIGAAVFFAVVFIFATAVLIVEICISSKKVKTVMRSFQSDDEEANAGTYRFGVLPPKKISAKYICLIIGCVLEAIGYIGRAVSARNLDSLGPFIIQSVLLLVSPALMAASIYMIFGRILVLTDATAASIVPARYSTTIFVCGDILSFLMQASGGGLEASESSRDMGEKIIVGGLIIQIIFFGLFLVTEIRYIYVMSRRVSMGKRFKCANLVLLTASILIMIRSIVRTIEFAQGYDGYLISHEWTIFVFDAIPMSFVAVLFLATLPHSGLFRLEIKKAGRFLVKELDPMDCPAKY
ncbi:LADA_0D13344g1_1 [Lachancea dasiensis]|uniref:LADA_0D13344g1_1 n=1 Tax=Lachancea dasiensis TaxID=1072105 RepID=A0A1G4J8H3_9SACH|nr:LADA_0D13344g1_1 [Lachancea dasiensis]